MIEESSSQHPWLIVSNSPPDATASVCASEVESVPEASVEAVSVPIVYPEPKPLLFFAALWLDDQNLHPFVMEKPTTVWKRLNGRWRDYVRKEVERSGLDKDIFEYSSNTAHTMDVALCTEESKQVASKVSRAREDFLKDVHRNAGTLYELMPQTIREQRAKQSADACARVLMVYGVGLRPKTGYLQGMDAVCLVIYAAVQFDEDLTFEVFAFFMDAVLGLLMDPKDMGRITGRYLLNVDGFLDEVFASAEKDVDFGDDLSQVNTLVYTQMSTLFVHGVRAFDGNSRRTPHFTSSVLILDFLLQTGPVGLWAVYTSAVRNLQKAGRFDSLERSVQLLRVPVNSESNVKEILDDAASLLQPPSTVISMFKEYLIHEPL